MVASGLRFFAFLLVGSLLATGAVLPGQAMAQSPAASYAAAAPGERIALPPGDHGTLVLKGGNGTAEQPVRITSADPSDPARITGLVLKGAAHLVIEDLVFDYDFAPEDDIKATPFAVYDSRDVTLRRVVIDGDLAHSIDTSSNGFPAGFGLVVHHSSNVTLEDSEIRGFWRGLKMTRSSDLKIIDNDLHAIRMDGMNFAQIDGVLIEGNRIRDFDRSPTSADHADMIQFWTGHTTEPSRNITIRGNLLNSGDGLFTQSIFMGNNLVDQGKAGEEMYFRDVTIEDNLIINAHAHGISLGASLGVRIAGNSLLHNPASDGDRDILALYRPRLSVSDLSRDVVIENNIAGDFKLPARAPNWRMADNLVVQDLSPTRPNFYPTVFVGGDPADPASFMPRPDGPLDAADLRARIAPWLP